MRRRYEFKRFIQPSDIRLNVVNDIIKCYHTLAYCNSEILCGYFKVAPGFVIDIVTKILVGPEAVLLYIRLHLFLIVNEVITVLKDIEDTLNTAGD